MDGHPPSLRDGVNGEQVYECTRRTPLTVNRSPLSEARGQNSAYSNVVPTGFSLVNQP